MAEMIGVALQLALGIAFPWWLIRYDVAHLDPKREARAWNDASMQSAVVAFGPLALIVHFLRTRRSFMGLLMGLGAAAVTVLGSALVLALLGP